MSGLIDAAPTVVLRAEMSERLAGVMEQHEVEISSSLVALLDLPVVRSSGWFVISQFGEEADLNAGRLMRVALIDPAYKSQILAKLRALALRGETTERVVQLVAKAIAADVR